MPRPAMRGIRDEFRTCGGTKDRAINAGDLARHWLRLIEDDRKALGLGSLEEKDRQLIALRAAQGINSMALRHTARVQMDEWIHDRLLFGSKLPSQALGAQITAALRQMLQRQPSFLAQVQWLFEMANSSQLGSLGFSDIVQAYKQGYWRFAATSEGSMKVLSETELQAAEPERLTQDLLEAADLDGVVGRLSYAELLAFCLGRRKQAVSLALYDLSDGLASRLAPYILGQQMDGLWHSSIWAFGIEFYFGGEIARANPGTTKFGTPTKLLALGSTLRSATEFETFLAHTRQRDFNPETYDVLHLNCNHFSDYLAMFLVGRHIPENVLRIPDVANTPMMLKPLVNHWLGSVEARARVGKYGTNVQGGASRPPPLSRCQKDDLQPLPPGQVVTIQPPTNQGGAAILGQVLQMDLGNSTNLPLAPAGKTWVRYFEAPNAGQRGRLRSELVERQRLQLTLGSVAGGFAFEDALKGFTTDSKRQTSDSDSESAALKELLALGAEERCAEATLALTAGCVTQAAAVLRLQAEAQQDSSFSISYTSLGVPVISSQEPSTNVQSSRWSLNPGDLNLSRFLSSKKSEPTPDLPRSKEDSRGTSNIDRASERSQLQRARRLSEGETRLDESQTSSTASTFSTLSLATWGLV